MSTRAPQSGQAAAAPPAPGLFTRKATGLVRAGRTRDALFYNLLWSSVALTFATSLTEEVRRAQAAAVLPASAPRI